MLTEIKGEESRQSRARRREIILERVLARVCRAGRVRSEELGGGGRRAVVSRVREGVAYLWVEWLGRSGRQVAQVLGIRPESVYKAARRGQQEAKRWRQVLEQM